MKMMMTRLVAAAVVLASFASVVKADNSVQIAAAGLAETLSGPGPFTVCAPVNDACAALSAGTVESLLLPENKDQLTNVLLYHVDDRALMAGDFPSVPTTSARFWQVAGCASPPRVQA